MMMRKWRVQMQLLARPIDSFHTFVVYDEIEAETHSEANIAARNLLKLDYPEGMWRRIISTTRKE